VSVTPCVCIQKSVGSWHVLTFGTVLRKRLVPLQVLDQTPAQYSLSRCVDEEPGMSTRLHDNCVLTAVKPLRNDSLYSCQDTVDRGGWLEYLRRSPGSRKRRRKGAPLPGGIIRPPCSWDINTGAWPSRLEQSQTRQ
jgi:hypothetical protein